MLDQKELNIGKKLMEIHKKEKLVMLIGLSLIKFKETRNYVQRVLENINVYRYILTGKPIKIYNFFEDKTHYFIRWRRRRDSNPRYMFPRTVI